MRLRHRWAFPLVIALAAIGGQSQAAYTVDRLVTGLNQPTFVTQAPNDNSSLYIVERSDTGNQLGRVSKYSLQTQTKTTFLDLSGGITSDGGVLSVAFRPDYATSGLFYVTSNVNGDNRLDEYKTVAGAPQFQRRLLQYSNLENVFHTINQPFFQPGGDPTQMFVTMGDGGTQADSANFNPSLIESPNSVYGKVLRFDLNASFPTPATDTTHAGVGVVALGLRNPFRSGFDRQTGDFYIGDVGFNAVEEVDFIPAAQFSNPSAPYLDFGWTSREGTIATPGSPAGGPGSAGDLKPIFQYAHGSGVAIPNTPLLGQSITGGYVYRGPVPELQGRYFFSDFTNGNVYSGVFNPATSTASYNGANLANLTNHTTSFEALAGAGANIQYITSFGEDNTGNLYIVKFGNSFFPALGEGEIYRISAGSSIDAVINRTTGAITLTNNSGSAVSLNNLTISSTFGAIAPASLTPITGHYDSTGNGSVDSNNPWHVTSVSGSHTLFSEATAGDPGTLAIGQQVVLSPGGGWIPSTHEDLTVSLLNAANTVVNASVTFVGNGGLPFNRSDLNFDGALNAADWAVFTSFASTNLAGLSQAQAYGHGDLNADGLNDYNDFKLFKSDYIAANGTAAFAQLAGAVPEPATLLLASMAIAFRARRRRVRTIGYSQCVA